VQSRSTPLLKPLIDVTVVVLFALPPWGEIKAEGLDEIEKSGVAETMSVASNVRVPGAPVPVT
jgi:hypothetical protein